MPQPSPQPLRILIVEDEALIGLDIAKKIGGLGYEAVGPVSDSGSALDAIRTERIDTALLDVNLGNDQTTAEVAGLLEKRSIPFCFITAYTAGNVPAVVSRFGKPVIPKPLDTESLEALLGSITAQTTKM